MARRAWASSLGSLGLLATLAGSGCYTGLAGGTAGADGDGGNDAGDAGTTDGNDGGDAGPADELPAPTTRLFRLTHVQWENTVQDLLYLPEPTGLSADFRTDPNVGGFLFDNNAATLEVDQALWQSYQRAAVQIAEMVTGDPTLLAAIVPPDGGDPDARALQFVSELGRRAYRRPLADDERDALLASFDAAPALYEGVDPFVAGVRLVIETVLQSPHFLYRIETSTTPDGDVIPLTSHELAQRLSYLLWDSMPDDALFDAADADELVSADGLRAQAQRMLDDARARPVVQHFHDQAFDTKKFANAAPSPAFYPDAPEDIGAIALEENHRFIEDVVFEQDGGIAALLTSNETFVNDQLAALYGLQGSYGAEYQKATLDAAQRKGLLTQIGFLAANSSTVNPDPIHRGVFIAKRLACMTIAAPPNGVPPLPPADGRSNRQTVEDHTQQPGTACVGCHATLINPFGFPFENYDAVGTWRTEDAGFAVDAAADVSLDGGTVHVTSAVELADALAASPSVHECYTKHWVEFAFGRPFAPEDEAFAARVGEASQTGDMAVRELLLEIAASNAFRNRATQELP